jgi:hypothetical protein
MNVYTHILNIPFGTARVHCLIDFEAKPSGNLLHNYRK